MFISLQIASTAQGASAAAGGRIPNRDLYDLVGTYKGTAGKGRIHIRRIGTILRIESQHLL
jgi:hypothetical protein